MTPVLSLFGDTRHTTNETRFNVSTNGTAPTAAPTAPASDLLSDEQAQACYTHTRKVATRAYSADRSRVSRLGR